MKLWLRRTVGLLVPRRGYGVCRRCWRPWWLPIDHADVEYWYHWSYPSVFFVMCAPCWADSDVDARLDAAYDLWVSWQDGDPAGPEPNRAKLRAMQRGVRAAWASEQRAKALR